MRLAAWLAGIIACVASVSAQRADWPDFRGPGGQGHADGTGFPLQWGEGRNVVWKSAVPGDGFRGSKPVDYPACPMPFGL